MRLSVCRVILSGLLCCSGPALAGGTQAALDDCARIADVEVPDALHADADLVVYAPEGAPRLTVTAQEIRLGARTFRDPAVATYHAALHGFLTDSGTMASVARSVLNRGRYAQAASRMCRRILSLHAVGGRLERRFPGFVSPVRVRLKRTP